MNTFFPIYSFSALLEAAQQGHFKVLWDRVTKLSPTLVSELLRKQVFARDICRTISLIFFGIILTKSGLGPWYYKIVLLAIMWATLLFVNHYLQKKYQNDEIEGIQDTFRSFFKAFSDGAMIDPNESGVGSLDTLMMAYLVSHHLTGVRNDLRLHIALGLKLAQCKTDAELTDFVSRIAATINPTNLTLIEDPIMEIQQMLTRTGFNNAHTK